MTLKSVAARIRAEVKKPGVHWYAEQVILQFESDPEFTAPERLKEAEAKLEQVRALAEKYEEIRVHPEINDLGHRAAADTARRLRECLGEKP